MDLLTEKDIQALAQSEVEATHVSLFMPTHRFGTEVQGDPLQWKNLVNGVEAVLIETMRRPDVEALLQPARDLQANPMEWQYMSDGLAMFLRPGWSASYRIPAPLPELGTIGDHFVTGPLMHLLSGDQHYLLLALSQNEVRLMDGSRHTVAQVELDEVPTSLEDVIEPRDLRSNTVTRPSRAGSKGRAVFYGHGTGDDAAGEADLKRFLRQVATGLHDILRDQNAPLVLVGLDASVASYREVSDYAHTLDEAVIRNPDDLSPQQLHELAWPLVEARLRDDRAALIERFHALHGTGKVSSDPAAVREAAQQGRVDTLFVPADPWCWERVSGDELAIVQLGQNETYAECELLEDAAVATLANGGRVHATSQKVVAESDVAAILRY